MDELDEGLQEARRRKQRQGIIRAAASLFIERGPRAVTMDEVAAEAGVARRTIFNYYQGKEGLLYDVAAPVLNDATDLAFELAKRGGDGYAPCSLEDIAALCLKLWKLHGRSLSLIYTIGLESSERLAALHAGFLGAFRKLMESSELGTKADLDVFRAGRILYRCFVPLLLALEGADDMDRRFVDALCGLVRKGASRNPAIG
ncbi:MAG TPA: helix-turn-helix domain-containing protein [Spirochaetales bacterium]|nr:TetR/AcrR family transcriptional regulator [Spirochaetia bacterium]HPE35839.1 helix-turn-helix domain-containing protein [Spirochaetales bacterium]